MTAPEATRGASPFRRPAFRRLTIGWVATNLGDSALYLVLAIWVRQLTGSEALGAAVFIALGAPALLSPFTGHLADRVRRRPLMIATSVAVAVLVSSLLLVRDAGDAWIIFVVAFGYGLAGTVTAAAQSGLLRDMLPDEELGSANGTFSSIDNGMRIVSPTLGTGLYVLAGPWAVIAVSIAGFAVMALVLALTSIVESEPEPAGHGEPYLREVTAGFRALLGEPTLRVLAIAMATAFAATGLLNATVFPLIESATGAGPEALGPLQTVQGVGALVGGLLSALVMRRIGERWLVTAGLVLLAIGVAAGLASVTWASAGLAGWFGMGVAQLLIGLGVPWVIVGAVTYRMRVTPRRLQGRTSAAMNMLANVPQMLLLSLGAALLAAIDFRWLLLVCAAGIAGAALFAAVAGRRGGAEATTPAA